MKTDVSMKNDGKDFTRFDDLFRKVISVPKDELKRREEAEKKASNNEAKKQHS